MNTHMNRFPLWLAISHFPSQNIKSLVLAVVAGAMIGIPAGYAKGNETPAGTNAGPAGHWEADITGEDPQRIRVTLDLGKNAKSEWIASMGVPSENQTGMVVKDVAVNGKSVKFVAVEFMMAPFELTLAPDGSMKGTISSPGSQPVEFKRTGEAKVELIPASPAVSKELAGDWESSLTTPGGAARMVFHFRNQPDKTVMATIDTDHAVGLPLNNVKQNGVKVEFGMKIAQSVFQGTLNAEGTELARQLKHEESGMPLTLRKK